MATKIPDLTAGELRAGLEELLAMVDKVAALEDRIESKVLELQVCDWGEDFMTSNYVNALAGQLTGIYREARRETRSDEWDPSDLGDEIRAALGILDLSTRARDDAR